MAVVWGWGKEKQKVIVFNGSRISVSQDEQSYRSELKSGGLHI